MKKILLILLFVFFPLAGFAADAPQINDAAKAAFTRNLASDITGFQSEFQTAVLVKDFVPIEAKVGKVFIQALSHINNVLEHSLVRFINILLIVLYAFWIMFESYELSTKGGDAQKVVQNIIMKGVLVIIWIFVLDFGPGRIFMYIMGPIISLGSYFSDMILSSVSLTAGVGLPDTCAAIHSYIAADSGTVSIMTQSQVADLLCVPTRLSGVFYTAVAAGFKWMIAGIGTSIFTFAIGLVFVVLFIRNIYKFAITALGIVADLFFAVMFLPFTAISECFSKTNYKGIASEFFTSFTKLFNSQSLDSQITKFINAILYFISLSIIIAICAALLSGFIDVNLASEIPTISTDGFMPVLIIGCLVSYLATKSGDLIKQLGGSIDDSFGKQIGGDLKTIWGGVKKSATDIWKIVKK